PDGKWISYGQAQVDQQTSYVIPALGGEPHRILPDFASVEPPVWSPDSRLLVRGVRGANEKTCFSVTPPEGRSTTATGLCAEMAEVGLSRIVRVSAWTRRNVIIFAAVR